MFIAWENIENEWPEYDPLPINCRCGDFSTADVTVRTFVEHPAHDYNARLRKALIDAAFSGSKKFVFVGDRVHVVYPDWSRIEIMNEDDFIEWLVDDE